MESNVYNILYFKKNYLIAINDDNFIIYNLQTFKEIKKIKIQISDKYDKQYLWKDNSNDLYRLSSYFLYKYENEEFKYIWSFEDITYNIPFSSSDEFKDEILLSIFF